MLFGLAFNILHGPTKTCNKFNIADYIICESEILSIVAYCNWKIKYYSNDTDSSLASEIIIVVKILHAWLKDLVESLVSLGQLYFN